MYKSSIHTETNVRMVPNSSGAGSEEETSRSNGGEGCGGGKAKTTTLKKGPWTAAEDGILMEYVKKHGEGNWNAVQRNSGLSRCGKSCRLRWANHLRPNLKKGSFSPEEERLILELHAKLGNKWARMAAQLPGRTDNEIKNYWNTRVKRRLRQGLPLYPQDIQTQQNSTFHLQHNTPHAHAHAHTQSQIPLSPSPPPPQSHLSSPHPPTPSYSPSFSLFEPNSFSPPNTFFTPHTPPLLSSQFNRYKRYRQSGIGFSLPISQTPPPPSSPLGRQSMSIQLPNISSFQLGPANFDSNSLQILQTQFEPDDGLVLSSGVLTFSAKPELPSSQLCQKTVESDTFNDMKINLNVSQSNSGLLDDLLREAQAMSCCGDSRRQGLLGSEKEMGVFDGFDGLWDDSSSVHSPARKKQKGEPLDQNSFKHEDLSNIHGLLPSAIQPLWYSDGGEIFNGQSSGVTEENIGLTVQQLTSSLPITATNCNWDLPGIC